MESFTSTQWFVLVALGACNFLAAVISSLQAPFYPAEAEKKGASTSFAGIVLGIYALTGFFACPLVSNFAVKKFGSFTCFHFGMITTGIATLLFAFLNRINDMTTFLALSVILRIVASAGTATTFVSSYGFFNVAFPHNIGAAFAVMETMFAVGMATGPPLGEVLYALGNGSEDWSFTIPFLTMACTSLAITCITSILLWPMRASVAGGKPKEETNEQVVQNLNEGRPKTPRVEKAEGFIPLLSVPNIFVFYITVTGVSLGLGYLTCTLEPHLRQFGLSPVQTGGMFLVFGGVYASTASIWGFICDNVQRPIWVAIIGSALMGVSFLFMGPSHFVPLNPSLLLTGISLAMFGLGMSAIYVSGFLLMVLEAKCSGFAETPSLNSTISALWLSAINLGAFIGPIAGGILFEQFGFGYESLSIVVYFVVILLLLSLIFCTTPKTSRVPRSRTESVKLFDPERTPLMRSISRSYDSGVGGA